MGDEPKEPMITDEELTKRGYRKFENRSRVTHEFSDYFWQKRFDDDKGIKYLIEFYHYPPLRQQVSDWLEPWMAELHINDPHFTFQWHRPSSIADAEAKCETFFTSMGCSYYDPV